MGTSAHLAQSDCNLKHSVSKDGDWRIESELLVKQPQHKGINIASYLGALFAVGILSGDHIHACLDVLRHHAVHFDRLRAMHAIIIEADDKMCIGHANKMKSKHLRDMLAERCSVSGRFIWGPDVISSLAVDVGLVLERSDKSDHLN